MNKILRYAFFSAVIVIQIPYFPNPLNVYTCGFASGLFLASIVIDIKRGV